MNETINIYKENLMSKINRKKVITWKSKDSHRLEVFNGKFLTQQ